MGSPQLKPAESPVAAGRTDDPSSWVDLHGDVLYRYAILRVKDPGTAEDLVQETFLSALRAAAGFKNESTQRTWLVGILKHKIVDHFRKNTLEIRESDIAPWEEEDDVEYFDRRGHWKRPVHPWKDSPEQLVENKEFWAVFQSCLSKLPEAHRRAFTLREIDGTSSDEICEILSVSPANLWVMLHRARSRLRKCLDANWFGAARKEAR
jgi:RNA polymerase sigma-70 factor (ECF subfamily)